MIAVTLDSFVAVPVPLELYSELSRRCPDRVSSLIEDVAWDFLDRTAEDFEAQPFGLSGIQWQSLPLPEGTQLRTKYLSEYKTASVEGEKIMWEGKSYSSPSQLAAAMRGGTSNNAWKVLEIKRPRDANWQTADFLRR